MAVVLRFLGGLIGVTIIFGLIVFAFKQLKSVIDGLRAHRKSKSSDEQKEEPAKSPAEVSEKEVKQ